MTTANEILAKMVEARKRLDAMPIKAEIRMHPDDMAELRRLSAPAFGFSFLGIPVVSDADAPRMPRKRLTQPTIV